MSMDMRHIFRSGGVALASVAVLITGLIQQDQVHGVGWVIGSGFCSIGAVFLADIAGGIAGAVRTALAKPSQLEQNALVSRVDLPRLKRVVPWLAGEKMAKDAPNE